MLPDGIAVDVLIGMLMPGLIALVNQATWPSTVKGLIAIVVSVAAAGVLEWIRAGGFDLADWRNTAVVIVGAAIAFYRIWWRPSLWAPTIEAMTSTRGPTPVRTPEG